MFNMSRKGDEMSTSTIVGWSLGLLILLFGAYMLITHGSSSNKTIASLQNCSGTTFGSGVCKAQCDDSSELTFDGLGCKDPSPKCCISKEAKDASESTADTTTPSAVNVTA
jgi:hypothetical protein